MREHWQTWKRAVTDFFNDDAMTLAAALAFYATLSLAPLLIILLWAASFLGPEAQQNLVTQMEDMVGAQAAEGIGVIIESAGQQQNLRTLAGVLGFVALFFSASGVFAQLQAAMNRIWDVQRKPGGGAMAWIKKRLLSMGMILVIGAVLIASLIASAAVSMVLGSAWGWADVLTSVLAYLLLFAAIFKIMPDVEIEWHDVWLGAALTAILFAIGKWAIGLYLAKSSVGSSYGAAGSLVVLLLWVYYSSVILFLGVELTQSYARSMGHRVPPSPGAERLADERHEPGRERHDAGDAEAKPT